MSVFGMIEFERLVMVLQFLTNAAREGVRLSVLSETTDTDIESKVVTTWAHRASQLLPITSV
jgi:Flp pilus assembly protein TadG